MVSGVPGVTCCPAVPDRDRVQAVYGRGGSGGRNRAADQWRSAFSQAVLVRVERVTAWTRTATGVAYRTVPSPLGSRPGIRPRAWLGAGHAVQALAEQVGVAVVPGVFLDHVDQDPAEREPLATPQTPGLQRRSRGDQGARVVTFRPPGAERLGDVGAVRVAERDFPVQAGREDAPHFLAAEHRPEPVALDFGHVPDDAEQRQVRRRHSTLA